MEANWGKDDDAAIKALEENMILDPGFRDTRPKLYSLLINKADRLLNGGDRDGAFPVLMRALEVQPDAGEAQRRLATYTPTPRPGSAAAPAATATGAAAAASRRRPNPATAATAAARRREGRSSRRGRRSRIRSNRLAVGALDS